MPSKRLTGRYLYLSVNVSKDTSGPKFYFQISKKMAPKAVDRNLLKRRLRSILRAFKGVFKTNQTLVIGLKVKIPPIPSQIELKQDLTNLIKL